MYLVYLPSIFTVQSKESTKLELPFYIKLNLSLLILDADLETIYQKEEKNRFVMSAIGVIDALCNHCHA